jgi:general secretion pathway protein G
MHGDVIGRPDQARVTVARTDVRTIAASLEMYRLDNRVYPATAQGLEALVTRPSSPPVPRNRATGGYLPQLYVYRAPGADGPYDLISLGADGQPGGEGVDADILHGELP